MPIQENLRAIANMAKHDTLAILGLGLIGAGSILFYHMLLKMTRAGFEVAYWRFDGNFGLPVQYLKVGEERGWSPWPAYLIWSCLALGVAVLVAGLFLLKD